MKVEKLVVGQLRTNCFLVYDEKSSEGVIIDPGDDADFITRKISDLGINPQFILATHGHFDHVLAANELRLNFNIPFLIHQKDLFLLKRAGKTARFFSGEGEGIYLPPDFFLEEGQKIKIGKEELTVLETPGHTPGGVSFYALGMLFSGDLIFAEGVGRTDFSYSSAVDLEKSIKKVLFLPPQTVIYAGHGEEFLLKEKQEETEEKDWVN